MSTTQTRRRCETNASIALGAAPMRSPLASVVLPWRSKRERIANIQCDIPKVCYQNVAYALHRRFTCSILLYSCFWEVKSNDVNCLVLIHWASSRARGALRARVRKDRDHRRRLHRGPSGIGRARRPRRGSGRATVCPVAYTYQRQRAGLWATPSASSRAVRLRSKARGPWRPFHLSSLMTEAAKKSRHPVRDAGLFCWCDRARSRPSRPFRRHAA